MPNGMAGARRASGRRRNGAARTFQFIAGNLALDFVNTVAYRAGVARDDLPTAEHVRRWARAAGLLGDRNSLLLGKHQLDRIHDVRETLHQLFQSLSGDSSRRANALARVNREFAAVTAKRQVRRAAGKLEWTWVTAANDPDKILGPILWSAMELLVGGKSPRVRQCEDETCGWLFIDRSQGGRRRWCRMADCGNRAKARRHHRRVR
ncbi:MAG: CGNR zinc finger domain-containing protein [Gemmatimonadaceae bacterium]